MSLGQYLINPRRTPPAHREVFGEWIGERPVRTWMGVGFSTVRLSNEWMRDYRRLDVKYKGMEVYKEDTR